MGAACGPRIEPALNRSVATATRPILGSGSFTTGKFTVAEQYKLVFSGRLAEGMAEADVVAGLARLLWRRGVRVGNVDKTQITGGVRAPIIANLRPAQRARAIEENGGLRGRLRHEFVLCLAPMVAGARA